ncbi:Fanconi anaemia protein FancD2 nuclease-domain-containing protein [Mycotypha africana]|uniref:Fanconi anemia protein FancD2 nuclease-domain-containing protein n=1 Tax=Mycotypha africana TaxID=64632 RepID=UPI0023005F60|nr:Fanconi anemia protein FancD2 nuclease-domain-containing protein [Mycotypha africana]KAI8991036.1 Fanconi anaemia protein FancD2 nuclease-domain-containing protein [Mycotypha africana]
MCSIFNLMQSCEKQLNNGSLVDVDALFGCSIIMFNAENTEDLSADETEYACDMLFYTINWFRELLNAFMYSEEENFRERLIARLRSILCMENSLNQLMRQLPTYVPLEFHITLSTATEDIADMNRGTQIITAEDATEESTVEQPTSITKKVQKRDSKASHNLSFSSMDDLRPYLRPFDLNILEMFKYNSELENETDKMMLEEISYILEDLNRKLDSKIVPTTPTFFGKKKVAAEHKYTSSNTAMLSRISNHHLMEKIVSYLPFILHTLERLYVHLQQNAIEAGRVEGHETLVKTISQIFNIIYKLFQWEDLKNPDNLNILQNLVSGIAQRLLKEEQQSNDPSLLDTERATEYLSNFVTDVPQANTAVVLFKTIRLMMSYEDSDTPKSKENALRVVTHIVSTDWFDWRDIKKEIPYMIEQLIQLCDDPLSLMHNFIDTILPQYEAEGALDEFPLLKADTVLQHYQAILSQAVKSLELLKDAELTPDVMIVQTARIVKVFERITNHIKTKEQRLLLGVLLKASRLFVEQFTKYSIPYFTRVFKAYSNDIISIFKDFQSSTRMLQIICSHVKVLKDVTLAAYVPPLKKALEIVIYQVKMLLTENKIPPSAFFMGALKHRDIHGAEVSSQIPREIESDEEGDDVESDQAETDTSSTSGIIRKEKQRVSKQSKERRRERPIIPTTNSGQRFRTSELVPSSSEDEASSEEEQDVSVDGIGSRDQTSLISTKRAIDMAQDEEEEEEEEQIIEFDLNNEDEDNDEEIISLSPDSSSSSRSPGSTPPMQSAQSVPTKKRRLGLGRPTLSSSKKIFNFTNRSGR